MYNSLGWVQLSEIRRSEGERDEADAQPKLKLSDKLWVGFVVGIFVVAFALILIFDLF